MDFQSPTTLILGRLHHCINHGLLPMPFVALIAGIFVVVYIVRAWKNRPPPALADGITPIRGQELDEFREQARKETDL